MYYSIEGSLTLKNDKFVVVVTSGIGYRIFVSEGVFARLPNISEKVKLFIHHHIREDSEELYGFLTEEGLDLFESLISVSGVGPKSALSILDLTTISDLQMAISSGKSEFLSRASGIGKKTAERIIVELRAKFGQFGNNNKKLEKDLELEDALISLGYQKSEIRQAIVNLSEDEIDFQKRFKAILKTLGKK